VLPITDLDCRAHLQTARSPFGARNGVVNPALHVFSCERFGFVKSNRKVFFHRMER